MSNPPSYSLAAGQEHPFARVDDQMDIDDVGDRMSEMFFECSESEGESTGPIHLPTSPPISSMPMPPSQPGLSPATTPYGRSSGSALSYQNQPPPVIPHTYAERASSMTLQSKHPLSTQGAETNQKSPSTNTAASLHQGYPHSNLSAPSPPPSYAKVAMDYTLCIVCQKRPPYIDSRRAFPTCGNTCARKFRELQSNGGESTSYSLRSTSPGPIKMCVVCKARPRYEKGGNVFPTCGLTCAAKLNPQEKCEVCRTRAKESKTSPYCGTICRTKAAAIVTAAADAATCTTCLVCWGANQADGDIVCSASCREVIASQSPYLLEIPRGHVMFRKVNSSFMHAWKDTESICPRIKKIYKINVPDAYVAEHMQYKTKVENEGNLLRSKAKEQRRWIGVPRTCGFGESGNTKPCGTRTCLLCCLLRRAVNPESFPHGLVSTKLAERAVEKSISRKRPRNSKVVLLADIVLGTEAELSINDDLKLPQGSHSIKLMNYRTGRFFAPRGTSHFEESLVFDGVSVMPQYLLLFA